LSEEQKMPSLNRVELIGRLGKEPETHLTPSGKKVCTFSLAVDRRWKNVDKETKSATDWFNIEAWGRLGEIIQQYLHKGRLVYLEGRLQTVRYEQEGEPRFFTRVVARHLQMLERRPGVEEEESALPDTEEDSTE
jgi:single-strand DNA-binding protein